MPSRSALLTLLALSGCGGQGVTQTGFLQSYEGMKPTEAHTEDLIYVAPDYQPTAYGAVIVDEVTWQPAPGTPPRDPAVVEELKRDLRKSLVAALGKGWRVVDGVEAAPTPRVLRVRAAITNTRRANWYINGPAMLLGIVGVPAVPPNPGGASVELEAVDAATGKRMVAIATFKNGMPWNPVGAFQQFGHARRAFDGAAELLQEQLAGGRVVKAGL